MIIDILRFIWLILLFILIGAKVDIVESMLAVVNIVRIVAIIVHGHLICELLLLIGHVIVVWSEVLHWWLVHVVWSFEHFIVIALVERVADL